MDTSTPNPQMTVLVYTVIRYILTILGAFGVTWGASVSGENWQIIAGAIAGLISIVWSVWQKYQAAAHAHATAVASARAGKAIQPKAQ